MKTSMIAILSLLLAGTLGAGTITKGSIKHKIQTRNTCDGGACSTTARLSLSTSLEATLSNDEVGGLNPDSLFEASFPVGPSTFFRLNEDPNYEPGDTSAKISKSVLFNGVIWKHSISLKWVAGVLKAKVKITGSQKSGAPSIISWEGLPVGKSQQLTSGNVLISLIGSNLGQDFLSLRSSAVATFKTSAATQAKGTGLSVTTKQQIQGSAF